MSDYTDVFVVERAKIEERLAMEVGGGLGDKKTTTDMVYGRLIVERLIRNLYGETAADFTLIQNQHVFSLAKGDQFSVYFNISMSKKYIAVATSVNTPVGIDIESSEELPKKALVGISNRCFSRLELSRVNTLNDQVNFRNFYRILACKEAVVSVLGNAFSSSLKKIDTTQLDESDYITSFVENKRWKVFTRYWHNRRAGCFFALSALGHPGTIRVHQTKQVLTSIFQ
ncbi:4'-phosphopantetheinyl transferase superfamily protein [Vibrio sp. Of7-15]|uniref:4'-phosphopantetheinyl transferase family protein n=1 Tax=Vibrio sp. Of7-15 TaxID=2724879 RepID=UPI001EF3D2EF|nr:4'-phosphopantetheinyl transferase superfamily protein [Vibrio sp. Of7-15]MCG7495624.1 4'-phosphopantetheinyl transferase superfamily protein [Vibrio sp. Of7-15]